MSDKREARDGLLKRIGNKIERDTLAEFAVDNKPEEIREYVAVDEKTTSSTKPDKSGYIDTKLQEERSILDDALQKINDIQSSVVQSKRNVEVLGYINRSAFSCDVKWVINLIGNMKSSVPIGSDPGYSDALNLIESKIYRMVEGEMKRNKK